MTVEVTAIGEAAPGVAVANAARKTDSTIDESVRSGGSRSQAPLLAMRFYGRRHRTIGGCVVAYACVLDKAADTRLTNVL
ncbi:MAG: hypothetical protein RIT81_02970 [Deltaproteobacteria bacterium]